MPTVILRSLLGRVGVLAVALCGLYVTASVWLSDGYGNGVQALSVCLAVVVTVWLLWVRPTARLTTAAIEVRNAWRHHTISWDAVRSVQTRWGLVLEVAGDGSQPRRVAVSACPRGGLFTAMRHERRVPRAREEYVEARLDDAAPPVYRAHLDCDDAGYLIDLYRTNRAEFVSLDGRLRRRSERLERRRAGKSHVPARRESPTEPAAEAATEPATEAATETEPAAAGSVPQGAVPTDAVAANAAGVPALTTRWDPAPIALAALAATAVVLSVLAL